MRRPGTKEVIGVVLLLGAGLLLSLYVTDTFGTRPERRADRRERANQDRVREMFRGSENVLREETGDPGEEKAADERLRRIQMDGLSNRSTGGGER